MILIVTSRTDLTSDLIAAELERRQLPFVRLNTEQFLDASSHWDSERKRWITTEGQSLQIEGVAAVYFRTLEEVEIEGESQPEIIDFVRREAQYAMRSILALVPRDRWINHPNAIAFASNKLYQLELASHLGLNIPPSILSNSAEELFGFYHSHSDVICKSLPGGIVIRESETLGLYTWRVPLGLDEAAFTSPHGTPVFLQKRIIKSSDVRSIVIGDSIMSFRISPISSVEHSVDWRMLPLKDLHHEVMQLPRTIEDALIGMTRTLGLRYGAIDLLETTAGFYFLELNANGQWGWLQAVPGANVTDRFVSALSMLK